MVNVTSVLGMAAPVLVVNTALALTVPPAATLYVLASAVSLTVTVITGVVLVAVPLEVVVVVEVEGIICVPTPPVPPPQATSNIELAETKLKPTLRILSNR